MDPRPDRPGALAPGPAPVMDPAPVPAAAPGPPFEASFLVFAQARDARIDIDAWNRHAERFFAARLGLTEERRPGALVPPTVDSVGFVVAPSSGPPAVRRASARTAREADFARADAAEGAGRGGGLARLARRCGMVWLVEREAPVERDRYALLLSAVLASILLGPILDERSPHLFGVKTARAKLEAR